MHAHRTPTVDAQLIATLERAFARMAGGDGAINVKELQAALGLRSEYLARRVMAGFDLDWNGVITHHEFIEGVRKLVLGSDQDKLMFAFRVHDHDGDGTLSPDELYRMIAMSLSESSVTDGPNQSSQAIAHTLFTKADTNRDGRITFAEFEAVVRRYPAVLRSMTRSEAQWIAPNEDLLARLDPSNARQGSAPLFENGAGLFVVVLLWILANAGVFTFVMLWGRDGSPVNELMRLGKALGTCIAFNGAVVLVPVMRRLLSWMRSTWLGRILPIDDAIAFHRTVGHALFFLGLAHGAMVVVSYATGHPKASFEGFFMHTEHAITGVVLVVVVSIMWLFALGFVRKSSRFELFYFTHLLYLVWFVVAIIHAHVFAFWAAAPILGFAIEHVLTFARRAKQTRIIEAQALRSGVTSLELDPPKGFHWSPGDYAFLCIPAIAKHEWHPFTISSAMESGALTFHVRTLGNWTSALRRRVEQMEASGSDEMLAAYVDGPYGTPSAHIFDSRFAVFIGAGIGVTPFASVLAAFIYRANSDRPPRLSKAHFFWLNRDQYSFEWFAALLSELVEDDAKALLDVHLCMTAGRADTTALGVEVARQIASEAGKDDIVTGLRTHTHMGQPDWQRMLYLIREQHKPEKVDVYFCGPPGLAKKIRPICAQLGLTFREEKF